MPPTLLVFPSIAFLTLASLACSADNNDAGSGADSKGVDAAASADNKPDAAAGKPGMDVGPLPRAIASKA